MLQCRFIILRGRNTATLMKGFWVVIIACSLCFVVVAAGKKKGLHYVKPISPPRSDSTTHLFQETEQSCSEGRKECNDCDEPCSWAVPDTKGAGLHYSLTDICNSQFSDTLPNPRGATLTVSVCGRVKCGEGTARGCISVPGVQPTVAGRTLSLQTLVIGSPSYGFQLLLDEGERCEVTGKPRRTVVTFPCDPTHPVSDGLEPLEAYEGKGKDVCHYYMVFPRSKLGCPIHHASITDSAHIINIESVRGCMDSDPERSTTNCPSTGGKPLTIRATGISSLCPDQTLDHDHLVIDSTKCTDHIRYNYCVTVGDSECIRVTVEEYFTLTCTLGVGRGSDLSVRIIKRDPGSKSCDCRSCDSSTMSCDPGRKSCDVVAELIKAVSYKRTVNFRDIFDRFVEYGVGGLKKEVDELYRRAFASRGLSGELLSQLGISHIKVSAVLNKL